MFKKKTFSAVLEGRGALSIDELIPTHEYEGARSELLARVGRIKAARRTRMGPHFSVLFENRASVWLQVQEELRWCAQPDDRKMMELLDLYNVLIGEHGAVGATLLMDSQDAEMSSYLASSHSVLQLGLRLVLAGRLFRVEHREAVLGRGIPQVAYLNFTPSLITVGGPDRLLWTLFEPGVQCLPAELSCAINSDLEGSGVQADRPPLSGQTAGRSGASPEPVGRIGHTVA